MDTADADRLDASRPAPKTEEPVLNPRTGEMILDLPEASPAQIDAAVAAAEKAFDDLVAHDAGAALGLPAEDRRRASRRDARGIRARSRR